MRRRTASVALLAAVVGSSGCAAGGTGATSGAAASEARGATSTSASPTAGSAAGTAPASLVDATARAVPPSSTTRMRQVDHLTGGLSPKSVVANKHGAVIANNMMYNHSISVYDAASRQRVATIEDAVDLASLGVEGHPGMSRGAPVEGAFTKDGRVAYVSNYSMYGEGFGPEGRDSCHPGDGTSRSYLYRVDLAREAIDEAIEVGAVPKYVAMTPDEKTVLVSNWCSWTLSVVDVASRRETGEVKIAAYPRGIAVSPDSRYAYVTAMGTADLYRVDLTTMTARVFASPGARVRHVAISPDGRYLYTVSSGHNNGDGTTNVAKIDAATGAVLATVVPGREPRSLAISADGTAVYVVNYEESTVAKVRTDTMAIVQKVRTDSHPIGITYEPTTGTVWACAYSGAIHVFDDTVPAGQEGAAGSTAAPSTSG